MQIKFKTLLGCNFLPPLYKYNIIHILFLLFLLLYVKWKNIIYNLTNNIHFINSPGSLLFGFCTRIECVNVLLVLVMLIIIVLDFFVLIIAKLLNIPDIPLNIDILKINMYLSNILYIPVCLYYSLVIY